MLRVPLAPQLPMVQPCMQHGRFLLRRPAQHPPPYSTARQGSCEETVDMVRSGQWLRCVGGKGWRLELDQLYLAAVRWSALRRAVLQSAKQKRMGSRLASGRGTPLLLM